MDWGKAGLGHMSSVPAIFIATLPLLQKKHEVFIKKGHSSML